MCALRAAPPGLEPRLTVPKTAVLPLHHGAKKVLVGAGYRYPYQPCIASDPYYHIRLLRLPSTLPLVTADDQAWFAWSISPCSQAFQRSGQRTCYESNPACGQAAGFVPESWRRRDSNPRPPGYEPGEIPNFSTPLRISDKHSSKRSPDWTRTSNIPVNSRTLCQLSYGGLKRAYVSPSGV